MCETYQCLCARKCDSIVSVSEGGCEFSPVQSATDPETNQTRARLMQRVIAGSPSHGETEAPQVGSVAQGGHTVPGVLVPTPLFSKPNSLYSTAFVLRVSVRLRVCVSMCVYKCVCVQVCGRVCFKVCMCESDSCVYVYV